MFSRHKYNSRHWFARPLLFWSFGILFFISALLLFFGIVPIFAQDSLRPSVRITAPSENATYYTITNKVILEGTAADNVSLDRVIWRHIERGETGTATGMNNWVTNEILLDEGQNTFRVTAYDAAGNSRDDYIAVVFERGGGIVTITDPTGTDVYITASNSVNLKGKAVQSVSNMMWASDRGGASSFTASTSWQTGNITLQEGDNNITITAW